MLRLVRFGYRRLLHYIRAGRASIHAPIVVNPSYGAAAVVGRITASSRHPGVPVSSAMVYWELTSIRSPKLLNRV